MHSSSMIIKIIRWLLLPFSILYGLVLKLRNLLYDKKVLRSATFNLPVICIGNLSAGGTGKSPMVEYLITLLQETHRVAVLSRGYGRKTKGYLLASDVSSAEEIGDEPLQFKTAFPQIAVAVGERRIEAIPQLLYDHPDTNVIVLDDAFQHREISAGYNILLTEFDKLYTKDSFLPTGNLRDEKKSADRADIIVVTKCLPTLSFSDKQKLSAELKIKNHQHLFLSALSYDVPVHLFSKEKNILSKETDVLLVTAIANPQKLIEYLESSVKSVDCITFADHHHYREQDIHQLTTRFNNIENIHKVIITTSKDAVKLQAFVAKLGKLPIYVLPVKHEVLLNEKDKFDKLILDYVNGNVVA